MAKVTHTGPGDVVSIDGLDIARGKTFELDEEQIRRLQAAGAELEIDRSASDPPPDVWEKPAPSVANTKKTAGMPGTKED